MKDYISIVPLDKSCYHWLHLTSAFYVHLSFFNCDSPYTELSLRQVLKVGNVKKNIYQHVFLFCVLYVACIHYVRICIEKFKQLAQREISSSTSGLLPKTNRCTELTFNLSLEHSREMKVPPVFQIITWNSLLLHCIMSISDIDVELWFLCIAR